MKAEPLESTAGGFPQTPKPAFRHCVMGGYRYPISYPTQLATAVLKLVEKLGMVESLNRALLLFLSRDLRTVMLKMFQIVKLINLVDSYTDMLQERSIVISQKNVLLIDLRR